MSAGAAHDIWACLMQLAHVLAGSGHRLYLISRKTEAPVGAEAGPVEGFVVLGATGERLLRTIVLP